ncbi:FERRY endosomal RAB5 effector complex subunit 3-like [Apostichopus japonicus]|uniref:FERRY endosomal RAB5 effector complex subunit 3-like n=1 Tax=Stichopus japonicus TaxID=307972 RepID=UPI003AB4198C
MADQEREFKYTFKMKSSVTTLTVPVILPLTASAKEFVGRLMSSHDLPCFVEDDLFEEFQKFILTETSKLQDESSSGILKGLEGAAHDKIGKIADQWGKAYTQECVGYTQDRDQKGSSDFTDLYHKLIHSSALEVLFNLEHTYSVAVQDVVFQRDRSIQKRQLKQSQEMEEAVQNLDITHDDQHVNMLAARHFENMQRECQQWDMELKNLQQAQREEFKTYIRELANDTNNAEESSIRQRIRAMSDSLPVEDTPEPVEQPGMNESFTVNLGSQLKTIYNLRLMSMDVLDLCRHRPSRSGGRLMPQPQRLQSAMSLYSNSLSALVLLVDDRVSSYTGIKKEFASICQQSTDFHFPDMDTQLRVVQQAVHKGNVLRKAHKADERDRGSQDNSSEGSSNSSNEEISTNLQTGDFYITRHSNLSQVHLVFHLVSDDSTRDNTHCGTHPVLLALRNILKIAVYFDIYTITIPLLLVYEMHEEMTIQWCYKRAELVFKCVKGFMIEMTSGRTDGAETRTIQFVVPRGISEELFTTLSELVPTRFTLSRSLDLTHR